MKVNLQNVLPHWIRRGQSTGPSVGIIFVELMMQSWNVWLHLEFFKDSIGGAGGYS